MAGRAFSDSLLETQQVDKVRPDLVFFDLEGPHTEAVFALLKVDPALLLIGVSLGTNLVRVWNSQRLRGMSMHDLLELIRMGAEGNAEAPVKVPVIRKTDSGQDIDVRS